MVSATSPPTSACAHCSRATNRSCTGCKDSPVLRSGEVPVFYCSKPCQVSHWRIHKRTCKSLQALKLLYRTADVLQEIFYIYREHVFDKNIAKIEQKDGKLYIHDKDLRADVKTVQGETDRIVSFPHEMCNTDEDKKAVLVHLTCSDAIAWMHDLVKYLLTDITSDITEFTFTLHNHNREAVGVNILGKEDPPQDHDVWIVTLRQTGARYILDLTGAQFGYYQPVIPYEEFELFRVKTYVRMGHPRSQYLYFGGLKDYYMYAIKNTKADLVVLIHSLNMQASKALMWSVEKWEGSGGLEVKKMVELSLADFQSKKSDLLEVVDLGMTNQIENMRVYVAAVKAAREKLN
ncbi:hypothetical protein BKA65DRAFT_570420 [Rhexocercosporidium sp. MPI-PUGE-AT-0058]|nr:hypothetical protein BKA65DRAFT_570420 [Rhexocercosporidium sp. MPI-PUGE-AT-0058]